MSENFGLALEVAGVFLFVVFTLGILGLGIALAARDARRRGKSPWLVSIACVFFFPWGLIAWLVFRPDPIDRGKGEGFRLEDYRAQ
jgi:uncharacterized membrane protein YhaH (DUF805 family)